MQSIVDSCDEIHGVVLREHGVAKCKLNKEGANPPLPTATPTKFNPQRLTAFSSVEEVKKNVTNG